MAAAKPVKKAILLAALIVLVAVFLFPLIEQSGVTDNRVPRGLTELSILHTNDIHGQVIPGTVDWSSSYANQQAGGMGALGRFLKEERKAAHRTGREVLYIDAGDWFSGTPESDLLNGKPMIEGFNAVKLDYSTIGNHEFNIDLSSLKKRLEELKATVISSNLRYGDEDTAFPGTKTSKIADHGGIKIGFFGLVELSYIADLPGFDEVIFLDEITAARDTVKQLQQEEPDLIIGITHIGLEADKQLAREVEGIDLIVGGHSHSRLDSPLKINNTLIVQAGGNLSSVGRLDLSLDQKNHEIVSYRGNLITLYTDLYPPLEAVEDRIDRLIGQLQGKLSKVIGTAGEPITRRSGPGSELGNLVTDAMRAATGADLALQNAFGIRNNLPEGEITRRDVFSVLPFQNHLVELKFTGEQIKQLLKDDLQNPNVLMQLSGARVKTEPGTNRLKQIYIGEDRLDREKEYRVVTSNFLAETRNDFQAVKESFKVHEDLILWKLLEDKIERRTPLTPTNENRHPGLDHLLQNNSTNNYSRLQLNRLQAA